eukprot:378330-Rhodomonas_salina.2
MPCPVLTERVVLPGRSEHVQAGTALPCCDVRCVGLTCAVCCDSLSRSLSTGPLVTGSRGTVARTSLRTPKMSGGIGLRASYAVSGTDSAYGATSRRCLSPVLSATCLRAH